MTDKISEIISITITRATSAVSQAGFGTALLFGDKADVTLGWPAGWGTRVKSYSDPSELVTDVFDVAKGIYKAAVAYFGQELKPATLLVGYWNSGGAPAETPTTGLTALRKLNDDWYVIVVADRTDGAASKAWEIAQIMQAEKRLCFLASDDVNTYDLADVTSIAKLANAASHDRTCVIFSENAAVISTVAGWADMAWLGRQLATEPGDSTWAFKTLVGINPSDTLDSSQRDAILSKTVHAANFFYTVNGVKITTDGTVASGEYIDNMILGDWCGARIQEGIFSMLTILEKLPYSDDGVNAIKGEINRVLSQKMPQGITTINYITAPKVADIDQADKTNRLIPDVKFSVTVAGAIHRVTINGLLQL